MYIVKSIGRMQSFLCHGGLKWDGGMIFVYIYVHIKFDQ